MSEQKQFGLPEVLAALEAAVAERGEGHVYEPPVAREGMSRYLYTHEQADGTLTPGCIVGQVYSDLTGSVIPFTGVDQDKTVDNNKHARLAFTAKARFILSRAQIAQDSGETWGAALAAAKQAAGV